LRYAHLFPARTKALLWKCGPIGFTVHSSITDSDNCALAEPMT
jgi:hypothetical protein